MNYERRFNYQENRPIKERQYSYYITDINNMKENNTDYDAPIIYNNENNLVSSQMRMSNIESRLTTMEKMMKYFDEFLHLKEEEKMNNLNSLELSSNIPINVNELLTKINDLEKKLDIIQKQKQQSDIENERIIKNLNSKIEFLEKMINSNNLNTNYINQKIPSENNNKNNQIDNFTLSNEKINFEKNNSDIDEIIRSRLDEIYSNNKINEILHLIEEINQIAEDNEFNINEQNENIRKIQNDNLTLIKVVAVHSEKINSIDYLMNELTNLKTKYFKLLTIANNIHDDNEGEISQNDVNERSNNTQSKINNMESNNRNNKESNNDI